MDRQASFSDLEMLAGRPRATRRERFLSELDEACPWGGNGRRSSPERGEPMRRGAG